MIRMGRPVNQESSLSRLWKHNLSHDCGAMSAFRPASDCGTGTPYTREDNLKRSTSLSAKLRYLGYRVTATVGVYKGKKEASFFVVDSEDSGKLETDLHDLGEEFEQDSILFIPRGAINNEATAYLIGTSRCPGVEITYGEREPFERGRLGMSSPIYSTYINGRPFFFESNTLEDVYQPTGMGYWAMGINATKHWSKITHVPEYLREMTQ